MSQPRTVHTRLARYVAAPNRVLHRYEGCRILTVPGLHGSGERHWQSSWERHHPEFQRVQQADWSQPELDAWADRILAQAQRPGVPVIVVAHSFGCLAAVRAMQQLPRRIAAALLVAPADPARFGIADARLDAPLQGPSLLVASRNDPWQPLERARRWGDRWGSVIASLGEAGHINVESGHTEWPEGLMMLDWLCRQALARHAG
jgi:predicted alpha/beta hydrolase family esterase